MGVKGAFVAEEVVTPNLADKAFAGEREPFVAYHIEQQLIFLGGHLNAHAVNGDDTRGEVYYKTLVGVNIPFFFSGACA